ncbi:MAG: hypothetical protein HZA61_11430 [Candidatus Eisenbacteria bacterium]|uniref:Uncharacterized protein n=1 Tax=Eiseniibacteriota bacterium TaxID=2212470 RepID=A0A933SDF8_UNCEI|nr:hypothetical protein [Candidatus Eisenbacteria bacterium]
MFTHGQIRWFHTVAATLFVLTGVAHTIGQYTPGPTDPATVALVRTLNTTKLGDAPFTWWQVLMCWGAMYGAMSFAFGLHALAITRDCAYDPRVIRSSARFLLLAAVLQSVIALFYTTTPPAFFMIPAAVLTGLAAFAPAKPS